MRRYSAMTRVSQSRAYRAGSLASPARRGAVSAHVHGAESEGLVQSSEYSLLGSWAVNPGTRVLEESPVDARGAAAMVTVGEGGGAVNYGRAGLLSCAKGRCSVGAARPTLALSLVVVGVGRGGWTLRAEMPSATDTMAGRCAVVAETGAEAVAGTMNRGRIAGARRNVSEERGRGTGSGENDHGW